ncbi:MAG: hypothetical protein LBG64_03770 [Pseudomonadales bacterium]|jgi:hypothetical protein|nr:hypothetical protein [Pseudomonadales bacterium]
MPQAVFYCSFELKKESSVSDFLAATEKLNNEYISKQKGYVSWKQLNDGDAWVDFLTFETMDDVKAFETNSENNTNELALKFYSFINFNTLKQHYFTIEKNHRK